MSGYNFGLGHNFYEIVCFVSFTIKIVRFDMNRLIMIVCFLTIVWLNIVCFIWKFTNFGIVCFLRIVRFNIVCIEINVGEGSSEFRDRLDFFQRSSVLLYTRYSSIIKHFKISDCNKNRKCLFFLYDS